MIKKKNPVIEAIYFILCTHNHTTGKGSKKKISFWSTEENACIVEPWFRKQMNKKRLGDLGR